VKVGDLVKYRDDAWSEWAGIVIRAIPGTERRKVVYWLKLSTATKTCSYPEKDLKVISASR
jgi:hypothetical protein